MRKGERETGMRTEQGIRERRIKRGGKKIKRKRRKKRRRRRKRRKKRRRRRADGEKKMEIDS